jgi:hypothetical protein
MSIASIDHVRGKSQSKGSARALLLNLAIYANDCCGVAWPSDATLYHDVNVSRQRIHELKNALEKTGELVIVERPGFTNLYFVAWQGVPLGGTPLDTPDGHHPRCPLRHPRLAAACARRWPERFPMPTGWEGSDAPDTPVRQGGSDRPDPQGSGVSDGGGQEHLTRKQFTTREKTLAPPAPFSLSPDKPERRNPFWCEVHGFCHGERLPDHRPDCRLELPDDPRGAGPEGTP